MLEFIKNIQRKVWWFACFGAVGGAAAAVAGEMWLWATTAEPRTAICLLLDTSGSMSGGPLEEMKLAASEFVTNNADSNYVFSVVGFDSYARTVCHPTADAQPVNAAITSLHSAGGTNMAEGIAQARATLDPTIDGRFILIFTDGMPDSASLTLTEAENCRQQRTGLIAVATGGADSQYLAQLTGDSKLVFPAVAGKFAEAFAQADRAIQDLVGAQASNLGSYGAVVRVGVWTALLAIGVSLALIAAQNIYLGRAALSRDEAIAGTVGGVLAGLLAGGIGQVIYASALGSPGLLLMLTRILGWIMVGMIVGAGLARCVPNLQFSRGLAGGAVGGAAGVIAFLILGSLVAAMPGRLAGAAIVGFCIGAMIAWFEAAFREAWLDVKYATGEVRTVSLGRQPVSFGSDSAACTVFIPNVAPVALRYTLEEGVPRCEDVVANRSESLQPEATRSLGNVVITLKAAGAIQAPVSTAAGASDRESARSVPTPATSSPPTNNFAPATSQQLQLVVRGRTLSLVAGATFRAAEIPGLEPAESDGVVAEVTTNPQDASVLGLKNRSRTVWQATTAEGKQLQIDVGRNVRLDAGVRIRFGLTEGLCQRQ